MMKRVVILTIFLLLAGIATATIQLDKEIYQTGEIVTIRINYTNLLNKTLQINTVTKIYNYQGTILPELNFLPQEQGNHTIILKNEQGNVLENKSFWVGQTQEELNVSSNQTVQQTVNETNETETNISTNTSVNNLTNKTILNKEEYVLGETVLINLSNYNFTRLRIIFENQIYTFLGEEKTAKFIPKKTGNYTLLITLQDIEINKNFKVMSNITSNTNTTNSETQNQTIFGIRIQENVSLEQLNKSTNLELYTEYPDTVKKGMEIPIRIILWATKNDTYNITVEQTIPINWKIVSIPEWASINENTTKFFIGKIESNKLYSFNYTLKSSNETTIEELKTHLSYIDKLNLTSKEYNNTINLTENGSYFDIELDLYTGNQEVTRDIKEGVTYKGEIRIKNLGESVTNFETYFDWDYDEELIKLTSNEKECKINTDQGKYLRCEFKTFMENETKTVDIKVLALKEGSQFAETITRYDPPINLNKIFNAIKNFFAKIFDSIGGGLTGQVVREIPESNDKEIIDVNLEETTKQEVDEQPKPKIEIGTETDKEEINLPPRVNLKQLPNFVTGNIVLDASETTDYEGDLLNYKFLLSKDETFENPNILCFGESPTCNWNTEVSDCVYCYIQLVVLDGKDESYSKIMRTFRLEQEEKPQDIKENATEEAQETTTKKKKKGSGTTQTIIEKKYDIFSDPTKTWITTKEKLFFKTTTAKENQTVKVFGKNNTLQNYTATIISETFEGKKSVILEFTNSKKIARIEIRNLEPDTEIEIGIEEELENVSLFGRESKTSFALDPTRMNFTSADITIEATGEELWKCKDWNFTEQKCYGSWQKIMDIKPGQNYTLTLTPEDPGYTETGLATVNTNKSIYHLNEEAEIKIAVLDREGFLVKNANVTLEITDPHNNLTIFSTDSETIMEEERGIYITYYNKTSNNGTYNLFITAKGENVDSNMSSFFVVSEYYEYDILREVPISIDPFSGPFNSTIKIISYTNATEFNLTEKIPVNFTIKNSGGAIVVENKLKKELTWIGLTNNSIVTYYVQAPLITPELWELGQAVILSSLDEFIEVKPWYLAADPLGESRPTTFTDGSNIGSNEEYAYDENFGTSASLDIDANANPAYVVYTTFNISGINSQSMLNSFSITYSAATTGTFDPTPDTWYLEYSTNTGSSWTVCSSGTTSLSKQNITCNPSFSSWTIQDFADNFQVRAGGEKNGGPDAVTLELYETWAMLNYTPPNIAPTPLSVNKNSSSIYVNDTVTFNATWIDSDDESLDSWWFSWNITGTWENLTAYSFTSNNLSSVSMLINATTGTIVEWRFYANDTRGGLNYTTVQSFTVLGADTTAPTIDNESVTPTFGVSGTQFNITADVVDDQTIQDIWAEVMLANGLMQNYSMNIVLGNEYSCIYNSTSGGNLSFVIYASDGTNDNISATRQYFNVTANITTTKNYYARGDSVIITGIGFYPGSTINLDIIHSSGVSVDNYPTTTVSDENGVFTYSWDISSSLDFKVGNYTITVNDTALSWLESSTEVKIVMKPSSSNALNDNPGSGTPKRSTQTALSEINDSDNIYKNMVSSGGGEVYLEANFTNVLLAGYLVNYATLYFEHYELSTESTYVQWYNSTAAAYQTICTIANQVTETFSSCDLSNVVTDSNSANSLSIRLSDNNLGSNDENWTMIDFVYLDIDFNLSLSTAITINEPTSDVSTYDSNIGSTKAYDGGDITAPPSLVKITGTEASSTEYSNIQSSNGNYFHTQVDNNPNNQHAYQSFIFTVTDSTADITSLVVTHEGYATESTSELMDSYYIFLWNFTADAYQLFGTASASLSDQLTVVTAQGDGADFINSTSGELWILVEGDFKTGGSGGAQADLWTDYIKLDVNKIPILSGNQNINATVTDGDGVGECNYFYTYENGSIAITPVNMENLSNNIWFNISNTNLLSDGFYYLYVNCTDVPGTSKENESIYVKIANAEPTIQLVAPENYANFTYSNINFTWNATQSSGTGVLSCNLSIDGTVRYSDVSSNNGQNITKNVTLNDGLHYWNVSCVDSSGLRNNSVTWQLDIDTQAPQITLNSPNVSDYINVTDLWFFYTPTDTHNITNCTLIINNAINQTNHTIINGTRNNFTISSIGQGFYNWSVNCSDNFGWTSNSSTRRFVVDREEPSIQLNYPDSGTPTGSTVNFNWTASDNLDMVLLCNITIDGIVQAWNIESSSGQAVNYSLPVTDGVNYWNVTCWDNATNINTSETRTINVTGPPTINLQKPENGNWTNSTFINFLFYVEDGNGVQNCSFYWDGNWNQSKPYNEIINFGNNTFNLTNAPEGEHNWSVECVDNSSESTQTNYRNITVDYTKPSIELFYPLRNQTLYSNDINFNFTATDNLDSSLMCNLSIDGTASTTNNNFEVLNNTVHNLTETSIDQGVHNWTVTCWDNATNLNVSEEWNFTIDTGPTVNLIIPNNTKTQENVSFLFYVEDVSGIYNCTLIIDGFVNESKNYAQVNNYANNTFNITKILAGTHNWTVKCIDNGTQSTQPTPYNFVVDVVSPTVIAYNPNNTAFSANDIEFNFTAIDDLSSTMTCNVSVDNWAYSGVVTAQNGSETLTTITGISDGNHTWNVTCWDEANNSQVSNTLNFTIDAEPQIFLDKPDDKTADTDGYVVFTYEVYESNLENCSLILNDKINITNTSVEIPHISDGSVNNFTLTNMPQGLYNWTVNCTDTNGLTGTDTKRELQVDWQPPNITLNYPLPNETIYVSTIIFNWTAYDNVDPTLVCNLSINEVLNESNINSTNGEATTQQVTGFTVGNYTWNITCIDTARFVNYSETRNFTVSSDVRITLNAPEQNATDGDGTVVFTYTPESIEGFDGSGFCDLYIDGNYNATNTSALVGQQNTFVKTITTEGNHTWYINCTDDNNQVGLSENRTFYIDLTDPSIKLNYPDGETINVSNVNLNWTAYDNMDLELLCNITLDSETIVNGLTSQNSSAINYSVSNLNDSIHYWNVTCADNGGRGNTSLTNNFTIQEPPKVSLGNPPNASRNNTINWSLYYTPTDNSGGVQNCTLILNSAENQTNKSVSQGQENNFTLLNLIDGTYIWDVNCTDPNGNSAINGTPKTFYVDLSPPDIELHLPSEGQTFNQNNINFNWTATDFTNTIIMCNLTVSDPLGERNVTNLTKISGLVFNATTTNLSDGIHYWNISCVDDLGNANTSVTRNFTINQPDLNITTSKINFNNTNPNLNENITISADVSNVGGSNANNVLVEFWNGNPETGTFIGNDTASVLVNQTIVFNTTWIITAGYHTIYVLVDPNNTVGEEDETNNNATKNISILTSTINNPENSSWTISSEVEINFTITDYTTDNSTYKIFVDGSATAQTGSVDNTSKLLNISLVGELSHEIIVEATDSIGRKKNSTALTIIYDATGALVNFETLNGTFFDDTTPEISFNITDKLANFINYTLFIDASPDSVGNVSNGTSTNVNLSVQTEGRYNITIESVDEAGNKRNDSIIIFIDQTKPKINLTTPTDGQNFTIRTAELNFSVTDNLDETLICNLTLDSSVIRESFNVVNNTLSNTTTSNLGEGIHYWNVTCWDGRDNENIINLNTSETRTFNVFIPPNITLDTPKENNWTSNTNQIFYFNISDETGIENCSIRLDGIINDTKIGDELTNNGKNNFTINNLAGSYNWSVECYDNSSFNTYNITENRTIHVDIYEPEPSIETSNGTWFNSANPSIDFNITDNMDLHINYTFYVNGTLNVEGNADNGSSISTNLQNLNNGSYIVELEALDNAGNRKNSTNITIFIDTVKPSMQLYFPEDGNVTSDGDVYFNWTANDNLAPIIECNLTIDGDVNITVNVTNGVAWNETVNGLNAGLHHWNVTCIDLAGNFNTSETRNFTVPMPDLYIESDYITFNKTSPEENETITINATIKNIGNTDAGSFKVQFWNGDPDNGGEQINGNLTIASLATGANTSVNVSFNAEIGLNTIFVLVDVPLATNGAISEDDETNNEANNTFIVEQFHIIAGTTNDELRITDASYVKLFTWSGINLTDSNVYVADTDSNIEWGSLQAVGRNTTNETTTNDFEEIDIAFGSTSFTDSINKTYTNAGSPKLTQNFTVFSKNIGYVPVVNSTNTSDFVTGLLWDYSDGNVEFNATQDLLLITRINQNKTGKYGTYDYEIKVPAPLRSYKGATNMVTFYTEII